MISMVLSLTSHACCVQERKEAEKLYPDDAAAALAASNTFEPDEDLQAAQAQAGVDAEMTDAPAASTSGKGKAGPTPQQLIAVKAAIANAATLEEIQRLEAALVTGSLPSEFTEGGGSGAAHGDAMLVG